MLRVETSCKVEPESPRSRDSSVADSGTGGLQGHSPSMYAIWGPLLNHVQEKQQDIKPKEKVQFYQSQVSISLEDGTGDAEDASLGLTGGTEQLIVETSPTLHEKTNQIKETYQCSYCHKKYTRLCFFNTHLKLHREVTKMNYECSYCKKPFNYISHLRKHERKHTGERPYPCSLCEKSFSYRGSLKSHERKHTGAKPYRCNQCDKWFSYHASWKRHHDIAHAGYTNLQCRHCDKRFSCTSSLKRHERTSHAAGEKQNSKLSAVKENIVAEMYTENEVPDDPPGPAGPEGQYSSMYSLPSYIQGKQHIVRDDKESEKPDPIYPCHISSNLEDRAGDGEISVEGANYLQPPGGKEQSNVDTINHTTTVHEKPSLGRKEEPYKCEYCEKRFVRLCFFNAHVRSHAEMKKKKKKKRRRKRTENKKVKRHCCSYCNEAFLYISSLKVHERKHTGEKPFECNYCTKRYSTKGSLKLHKRIHHRGAKPSRYGLLSQGFPPTLENHESTYTEEKRPHGKSSVHNVPLFAQGKQQAINQEEKEWEEPGPQGHISVHNVPSFAQGKQQGIKENEWQESAQTYTYHVPVSFPDGASSAEMSAKDGKQPTGGREQLNVAVISYAAVHEETAGTRKETYQCAYCEKKYTRRCFYDTHIRSHTEVKMEAYRCSQCCKSFLLIENLREHQKITHKPEYQCSLCDKRFSHIGMFNRHERMHIGERPYQCRYCHRKFVRESFFHTHVQSHIEERKKSYQCSYCSKTFFLFKNFSEHQRTHTGETPYRCSLCEEQFSHIAMYKQHERMHAEEKLEDTVTTTEEVADNPTGGSSYIATVQITVKKEEVEEDDPSEEQISIATGPQGHSSMHNVPSFVQGKHQGIKEEEKEWEELGQTYTYHVSVTLPDEESDAEDANQPTGGTEELHVNRSIHTIHDKTHAKETYQCSYCKKKFVRLCFFNAHVHSHTEEGIKRVKPYQCRDCNKAFIHIGNLKAHERKHTEKISFKCRRCNKTYATSGSLKRHKKLHTLESFTDAHVL